MMHKLKILHDRHVAAQRCLVIRLGYPLTRPAKPRLRCGREVHPCRCRSDRIVSSMLKRMSHHGSASDVTRDRADLIPGAADLQKGREPPFAFLPPPWMPPPGLFGHPVKPLRCLRPEPVEALQRPIQPPIPDADLPATL